MKNNAYKTHIKSTIYFLSLLIPLIGQTLQSVTDEKTGDPMLVGIGQKTDLMMGHFGEWFNEEYDNYNGDENLINASKDLLTGIKIETYLGTWCGDSRREVPRLYKILDEIKFPINVMGLIFVNRDKKSGHGVEDGKNIHHVPTIIFYKNGEEIGRIIESPVESLEEDIFNILIGSPQLPNYYNWELEEEN
ncbi:MAG: thioredoxin family protein [Candidatus Marinimicrobia bacterium]|jgi:thiol-disulfide isomerase/thioredoxin|nr:thioredoxin family protein [Candidatus Neomarinimicrobiota bacterium]MBT3501068.1 thioredoxin family protein [Candidatus Neomarinimicrobiota bacterium]MBT3839747.1 thioredoxin family protein [Candidatus Neomarinimicrobiota bacterium]MBT3999040.1 thioredoxin family protein [Candidatus Neomarinimicrobiota bacterium]MBT4283179.1 thioredoxin family protein [Candidatus Neomarinimicrobiota bacterium]